MLNFVEESQRKEESFGAKSKCTGAAAAAVASMSSQTVADTKVTSSEQQMPDCRPLSQAWSKLPGGALDISSNCIELNAFHDLANAIGSDLPQDQVVAALRPCLKAAESMVIRSWQQSIEAMEKRLLSALKQAAREIVDHLEKEAGARVVMAECKAAMVEQEHIQTKQQAHAMMLRLKDTSDTMIMEVERKLNIEKKRVQDAEAKVLIMQETTKQLRAELKCKGDILDEMQRHSLVGMGEGARHRLAASMNEGVSTRRKGSRSKQTEVKPDHPLEDIADGDIDDSVALPTSVPPRLTSPTDLPSLQPVCGIIHSGQSRLAWTRSTSQEHLHVSRLTHDETAVEQVVVDEGTSTDTPENEPDSVGVGSAEQSRSMVSIKGGHSRIAHDDEVLNSCEWHDSNRDKSEACVSHVRGDVHHQDMKCMDDGALVTVAHQSMVSAIRVCQSTTDQNLEDAQCNGQQGCNPVSRVQLEEGHTVKHSDELGVSDRIEESRIRPPGKTRGRRLSKSSQSLWPSCEEENSQEAGISADRDEGALGVSEVEQLTILRHSPVVQRKNKKREASPERQGGHLPKEKKPLPSTDAKPVESSSTSPKVKVDLVDAQDGSSNLVVESARDSRRLMQVARQLLSLRKL